MSTSTNSKTQRETKAKVWLKPNQIEKMRNATVRESASYLSARNDAILALLYDSGLRVGELVQLDVAMFDLDEGTLGLPANIQKDYPNENSPTYTRIGLKPETVRVLTSYLNSRWKDPDALLPSRQSDRMTEQSVRNVVEDAAVAADIEPFSVERGRGDASDVSPHTLRHSVAYRMISVEEKDIYAVTRRLRHATIQTTERVYAHFDRV
ncbi:integrase/recombinase XerC [Halogranum amylolyticum]|uniref:Integrase/recombinase XerC n=1 Tax=Halogranum amylolyticum TaxID=660520 RepID=A0A1H8TYV4_9EURY|nr:tyrosine-type recombinase/integrase [Halogranum amylolyticum]SEO95996.1 integrase/recombinase XerC [Halogranum amylolyticum]